MTSQNVNSFLTAYLDANKKLVKTLVIKSQISADSVNADIVLKYGESMVDGSTPQTWKYYMNIAGQYHFTDVPMKVISLDTLSEIAFTEENLLVHTATAEAYAYGTRYYYSLLSLYPSQEALILGILTPVDINTAVAAEDGSILGYPSSLVEAQESTLIPELEVFIKGFIFRWHVSGFLVTDTYYALSLHYILYLQLLPRVLNLRLKRCKTDEAHSFHVRQYLASHGHLDQYMPYMTLKQSLYIYRNINYIERNAGSSAMFTELLQKLLTDRRIPLAEYSIRQLNTFDDSYYPLLQARRKSLGTSQNTVETEYVSMDVFIAKEDKTTYGNPAYYPSETDSILHSLKTSPSSAIQTKDLESAMIDYNDAVPDPLPEVLLRQWAMMSTHSLYNVAINFQDPVSGERFALLAKDAFIYMNYISLRCIGIEVLHLPSYMNLKFRRHPRPNVQELLDLLEPGMDDLIPIAYELVANQPVFTSVYSVSTFFTLGYGIYQEALKHWFLVSNTHDVVRRGVVKQMVLKLYADEWIDFGTEETYAQWLLRNNLPEYDFTYTQAQALILEIFQRATGYFVDDTKSLKGIQRALVNMFAGLSSYSIQFMTEINDSDIIPLNWAAIRIGNAKELGADEVLVRHPIWITDILEHGNYIYYVNDEMNAGIIQSESQGDESISVETGLDILVEEVTDLTLEARFTATSYTASYDLYDPVVSNSVPYIGVEFMNALTEDQRKYLKSVF